MWVLVHLQGIVNRHQSISSGESTKKRKRGALLLAKRTAVVLALAIIVYRRLNDSVLSLLPPVHNSDTPHAKNQKKVYNVTYIEKKQVAARAKDSPPENPSVERSLLLCTAHVTLCA